MGGPAFDVVANPLGAVRLLYERAREQCHADPATLAASDWGVEDLFRDALFRDGLIHRVPVFDTPTLGRVAVSPTPFLVRFLGLVQDMGNTEFYQGLYRASDGSLRTSKFQNWLESPLAGPQPHAPSSLPGCGDSDDSSMASAAPSREQPNSSSMTIEGCEFSTDADVSRGCIWERHVLHCVRVPGLQAWALQGLLGTPGAGQEHVNELALDQTQPLASAERRGTGSAAEDAAQATGYRVLQPPESTGSADDSGVFRGTENGRDCTGGGAQRGGAGYAISAPHLEGHPCATDMDLTLGQSSSRGERGDVVGEDVEPTAKRLRVDEFLGDCGQILVKVYQRSHGLALNDVAEFVGVLSLVPREGSQEEGQEQAQRNSNGQQDIVMHCFLLRKLPSVFPPVPSPSITPAVVSSARASLVSALAACLGGDALAAEYLLLHFLSRVHLRVDPAALGKLSLNLLARPSSQVPHGSLSLVDAVKGATSALLPCTVDVDLHCPDLSTRRFTPYKDYDKDRLVTGLLQLPPGAHLTVNETTLEPGTVSELGVANIKALADLMQWQTVSYDFQFYKVGMPTDVAVLVLSQARSRMLPADVTLVLSRTADFQAFDVSPQDAATWRQYMSFARSLEHKIDSRLQEYIESELVAARQADRSRNQETFHRWLTMSRLMSSSHGCTELRKEHWEAVRQLEHSAEERLRVMYTS